MPVPPEQTVKQQREARRAEKVAALKKQQDRDKRFRLFGIIGGSIGVLAVLGLVAVIIASNIVPKVDPETIEIEGLQSFPDLTAVHIDPTPVDYEAEYGMNPPAGGNHFGIWLNCGIYTEPQVDENAVHALEHGAVWVTYDPDALSAEEITTLQNSVPSTYMVVSPYPGLPAPVVASAWGKQVQLDGVDDERLEAFISKFWKSPAAPEPGASCVSGIDGPGRIA